MKNCTQSGQWTVKEGLEWTDYTPCLNKQVSFTLMSLSTENIWHACECGMSSCNNDLTPLVVVVSSSSSSSFPIMHIPAELSNVVDCSC